MSLEHSASQDLFVLVTGDGNAYAAQYVSKATENKAEKVRQFHLPLETV